MGRLALMAVAAIALVAAGAVALITRTTGDARTPTASPVPAQVRPAPAEAARLANASEGRKRWPPESAATGMPAAGGEKEPSRSSPASRTSTTSPAPATPRLSRAKLLLRKQELADARGRAPAGPAAALPEELHPPPDERAAAEAAGIDTRMLERMVEGGAAGEEAR